jgi:hypothetical protein
MLLRGDLIWVYSQRSPASCVAAHAAWVAKGLHPRQHRGPKRLLYAELPAHLARRPWAGGRAQLGALGVSARSLPLEVVTPEAKAPSGQAKNNHYMYLYYFN